MANVCIKTTSVLSPYRQQEPNFASTTTATTSDDDVTHYHAYTQTSDSDQKQKTQMSRLKISGKITQL